MTVEVFLPRGVFGSFANEGMAMLGEGVAPASIERAAETRGMPVGPLAVSDEVSLALMMRINTQTEKDLAAEGKEQPRHPARDVVEKLVSLGREGRKGGKGFYEYPKDGPKKLWPGLAKEFASKTDKIPYADIGDRLLYIQAIETVRCLEENVLRTVTDGNIGSIFGFGFAPWSGGALQYINHIGLRAFADRASELANHYGSRFSPPKLLLKMAERNETFE